MFPDEVELRSIWIALVYLTLEQAKWPQKIPRAHEISASFMVRPFYSSAVPTARCIIIYPECVALVMHSDFIAKPTYSERKAASITMIIVDGGPSTE